MYIQVGPYQPDPPSTITVGGTLSDDTQMLVYPDGTVSYWSEIPPLSEAERVEAEMNMDPYCVRFMWKDD